MNPATRTGERLTADQLWSLLTESPAGSAPFSTLVVYCVPKRWGYPVARFLGHEAAVRLGVGLCRSWFGSQFLAAFRDAAQTKRLDQFRAFHRGSMVFAVDGLEVLAQSPAAQEEIAITIDDVEVTGGLSVFGTAWSLGRWGQFVPRLRSRLLAGLVLPFSCLELPPPRDCVGGSGSKKVPNSVDSSAEPAVRPSLEEIAQKTARLWGIRMGELRGPRRFQAAVTARQIAMYVSRSYFGYSLEQIGRYFGGRDHTTVAHACCRIAESLQKDPQLQAAVSYLCHLLGVEVPSQVAS